MAKVKIWHFCVKWDKLQGKGQKVKFGGTQSKVLSQGIYILNMKVIAPINEKLCKVKVFADKQTAR